MSKESFFKLVQFWLLTQVLTAIYIFAAWIFLTIVGWLPTVFMPYMWHWLGEVLKNEPGVALGALSAVGVMTSAVAVAWWWLDSRKGGLAQ